MARTWFLLPVWLVGLLLGQMQLPSGTDKFHLDKLTEDEYRLLLDRYRADEPNVMIALRAFWASVYSADVMNAERVHLLVQAPPEERVALAAMAQTDLALAAMDTGRQELANQDLLVADWLVERLMQLAASPESRNRDRELRFARDWQYAIICLRMGQGDEYGAEKVLRRATDRYPDDPELLLFAGTIEEMSAARLRYDPRMARGALHKSEAGLERNLHIVAAMASFRRAIARDPQAVEARIHLGYLLSEEEHARTEALTLLKEASALAANPMFKYLAALFAGHLEEQRGDPEAASLSYRTAIAACPRAQTARLALSHLQLTQYENERPAQNTLRPLNGGPPPPDDLCEPDPWRLYRFGQGWQFNELTQSMRRQVREPVRANGSDTEPRS